MKRHETDCESVRAVRRHAGSHGCPLSPRPRVVRVRAQHRDHRRLPFRELSRRIGNHDIVGKHRGEARDEIGVGARRGECAVGGEEFVDDRLRRRRVSEDGHRDGHRDQHGQPA